MSFVPCSDSSAVEACPHPIQGRLPDLIVAHRGAATDLNQALRGLLDDVCRTLGVPLALLSRDRAGWRFEAEAFPPRPVADAPRFRAPASRMGARI